MNGRYLDSASPDNMYRNPSNTDKIYNIHTDSEKLRPPS